MSKFWDDLLEEKRQVDILRDSVENKTGTDCSDKTIEEIAEVVDGIVLPVEPTMYSVSSEPQPSTSYIASTVIEVKLNDDLYLLYFTNNPYDHYLFTPSTNTYVLAFRQYLDGYTFLTYDDNNILLFRAWNGGYMYRYNIIENQLSVIQKDGSDYYVPNGIRTYGIIGTNIIMSHNYGKLFDIYNILTHSLIKSETSDTDYTFGDQLYIYKDKAFLWTYGTDNTKLNLYNNTTMELNIIDNPFNKIYPTTSGTNQFVILFPWPGSSEKGITYYDLEKEEIIHSTDETVNLYEISSTYSMKSGEFICSSSSEGVTIVYDLFNNIPIIISTETKFYNYNSDKLDLADYFLFTSQDWSYTGLWCYNKLTKEIYKIYDGGIRWELLTNLIESQDILLYGNYTMIRFNNGQTNLVQRFDGYNTSPTDLKIEGNLLYFTSSYSSTNSQYTFNIDTNEVILRGFYLE